MGAWRFLELVRQGSSLGDMPALLMVETPKRWHRLGWEALKRLDEHTDDSSHKETWPVRAFLEALTPQKYPQRPARDSTDPTPARHLFSCFWTYFHNSPTPTPRWDVSPKYYAPYILQNWKPRPREGAD